MQMNKTHLPSVLTLIVVALSILFLLALAGILAAISLMLLFSGRGAAEMIATFAFGFESLLLLACAWLISQKARGQASADQPYTLPFSRRQVAPGIVIILLGITIGGRIAATGIHWLGWLALPLLTVLVIFTPIWLTLGIASNGIGAGARWRVFAVLGVSMTVAPLIMVTLEIVFATILLIAGSVYLVVTMPDVLLELSNTMQFLLERPENIEGALAENTNLSALSALAPALICILLGMGVGMGAALIALNRRFRREEQARRSSEAEDADERVQLSA